MFGRINFNDMKTFKLFGLMIQIGKRPKYSEYRKMNEPVCKVIREGDFFFLTTPEGVKLPKQRSMKISEAFDAPMEVTVTLFANYYEKPKIIGETGNSFVKE